MFFIGIITLGLVAGQAVAHPPAFTLNDEHPPAFTLNDEHPPAFTLNDAGEEVEFLSVVEPFEMSNPSHVAAGELYQSDMLLSNEQWASLRARKAIADERYRWTEGSDGNPLVPYVFQDSVNQDDVRAALDHWMEHTCIKFEKTSKTDQPHLQFHIGQGCWSKVGMNWWSNGQQISIGANCNSLGTVVHEVGHAMGFHHEQSRSDRDDYVTILMENVEDGKEHNFDKANDNNYGVPYDYSSNMHYGDSYFTKNNLPTILTKDPMAAELIGSRNGLTHRDKLLANRMYNCIGKWLSKCGLASDPCLNDGYTGNDCTCVCPPGTSGSNCETVEDDYYAHLRNPQTEKIHTEKSIKVETPMDAGTKFIKYIVPPTCKKAKVTFTSANMFDQCQYQYLNVKTKSNDLVGQKMCSSDVSSGVTLTSKTGIIITFTNNVNYGSYQTTLWEADVTFVDIPECSAPQTPAPTNPPTPAPTNPPTPAPTNPPTPIITALACEKKPKMIEIPTGKSVMIQSENFPSPYPAKKISCGWKLKAPKNGGILHLSCDTFSLHGKDKLIISKQGRFTNTDAPDIATTKPMTIKFKAGKKRQ